MWWWNGYGFGPWMFGPFTMLLFIGLCFGMMWLMMRGMHGHRGGSDARAILDERFARGEIGEAEYWERRKTLDA